MYCSIHQCEKVVRGVKHRRVVCRRCATDYHNKWYHQNKKRHIETSSAAREQRRARIQEVILEAKREGCVDCNERHPACLDFDHVRGQKSFNISRAIRNTAPLERIMHEIRKCVVRCANCHRKKTAKEYRWYSDQTGVAQRESTRLTSGTSRVRSSPPVLSKQRKKAA